MCSLFPGRLHGPAEEEEGGDGSQKQIVAIANKTTRPSRSGAEGSRRLSIQSAGGCDVGFVAFFRRKAGMKNCLQR